MYRLPAAPTSAVATRVHIHMIYIYVYIHTHTHIHMYRLPAAPTAFAPPVATRAPISKDVLAVRRNTGKKIHIRKGFSIDRMLSLYLAPLNCQPLLPRAPQLQSHQSAYNKRNSEKSEALSLTPPPLALSLPWRIYYFKSP
jgi:hypothetical protein